MNLGMEFTRVELTAINERLLYRGAWLTRYSPGGGVTRYRLVDAKEWASRHGGTLADIENGNIPEPNYFGAVVIQTALGSREARIMVESYIAGSGMNRIVLKKAHRINVHQDRIRFEVGNLSVDWHVPGVNGGGRAVLPDDIKRASVTAAFKKGGICTSEDNLEFSRGKITVRVPLREEIEDHHPHPTNAPSAMPWEPGIMGVREAASGYPSRGVFTGVQFEPERIVAADGFRLYAMDTKTPAEKPTVIEAVALDVLKALKPERYWFSDGGMYAAGEDWAAYVPAMEGEYPDYMRVVPKEVLEPAVQVVAEDWHELLRTANQTNPDRDPHRLDLHTDGSVSHEQIHIEGAFSPLPVEQSYNGKYLLEALLFTGDGSELLLSGPQSPTLVRNGNRWAVIVPLRV